MNQFDKFKSCLSTAKDSLKTGKFPETEIIIFHSTKKSFHLWENFQSSVTKILETQKFHDFSLLLPAERGRVTRSIAASVRDEFDGCSELVKSCFKKFANYIEVLFFHLHSRFLPWPEWMVSCNLCFNFIFEVPDEVSNNC